MRHLYAPSPIDWQPNRRREPGSDMRRVTWPFVAIMAASIALAVLTGHFG